MKNIRRKHAVPPTANKSTNRNKRISTLNPNTRLANMPCSAKEKEYAVKNKKTNTPIEIISWNIFTCCRETERGIKNKKIIKKLKMENE